MCYDKPQNISVGCNNYNTGEKEHGRMFIDREDMLELTRRMTVKRNSFTRIAGCYINKYGGNEGTFNTHFLDLTLEEKEKNLKLAKTVPFSNTNTNLKGYGFLKQNEGKGSMWQLLMGIKACGLKNDALMEVFYEFVAQQYKTDKDYAVFVFHDCYDVPVKAADKERLGESEEVYDYLICVICPLAGDFEPGEPECGFLFPAFTGRSSDIHHIAVFNADAGNPHTELAGNILKCTSGI